MPETNPQKQGGGTPIWSRRWFWMSGGILAGLAGLAAVAPRAWAYRALAAHGFGGRHHAFAALVTHDPAAAKQHVETAVEWALRGVNANDEQQQQARRIADRVIDQLGPLLQKHHENTQAIAGELAKPEIDRAAIDRLRQQQVALADQASKTLVDGFTDLAESLTPEQRRELIAFAHRFHGEGPLH
jgi:Spy/CpxP family protein refolding chaperone